MSRIIGWLTVLSVLFTACVPPPTNITLTVFAAASLKDAFTEIGTQFEAQHPNVTISFNFAGSQQLSTQLTEGAPADVFASAHQEHMDLAVEGERITPDAARPFVRNRLAVIFPKDNPAQLVTLQDLARPGLKLILAAREVPVGQYTLDFLAKAQSDPGFSTTFQAEVLKNVVSYEENVRAVLSKVVLGEADAGIVYTSDVSGEGADQVGQIEIPDTLNTIATYPIAVVADSAQPEMAQRFVGSILSADGQATLLSYGFIPVKP
jgi:molybdate transport system substrate-binding protein